ncbi:hypothetical protein ADIMK_2777 [Marinobacterium lacunae]|uniref:STAS domain-containing protein n=2 Tax=Marinobacterium lacunae TaxID=1232683 RepID=A0A081FXJ8_9GAMM|nr:hypothetical protein ADIMK_2777 [Marinobacterium lacunae]
MSVRAELETLLSRQEGSCQLDLGGVTRVDSSALALWLAGCRKARRDGIELSIANLPADLKAIADLVGLDGALSQA